MQFIFFPWNIQLFLWKCCYKLWSLNMNSFILTKCYTLWYLDILFNISYIIFFLWSWFSRPSVFDYATLLIDYTTLLGIELTNTWHGNRFAKKQRCQQISRTIKTSRAIRMLGYFIEFQMLVQNKTSDYSLNTNGNYTRKLHCLG